MLQDRDEKAQAAQPSRAPFHVDVDLHVTRYHIEQAKTQRRRAKSHSEAPKRARARKAAADAAMEAAHQIIDADERKQALMDLADKAAASKRIAEQARSERDLVRRRMRYGFESTVPVEVGGRMREPFREKGLRSERLGAAGKLFVRGCRKGRHLRSANEKGLIMNQHRSKVLSLDYAWVEGNRDMVSLIRVDLDTFFESFEYLHAQLQRLVDGGRLPCLPHLVAGDMAPFRVSERGADGVFRDRVASMLVKPHLWFILPEAVNMKATGRAGPQRLLDAVYRGLVNVLHGLGADPNAKALLVRGKCPLAPWWESMNFNDDVFPSLSGYAAVLGDAMNVSLEDLARKTAERQSGLPTAVSNQFFTAASKEAWRILRELHERKDKEYLAALHDRGGLLYPLLARLMPMDRVLLLGEGLVEPARGAYVLDKVIGYAASRWSPDRADAAISFRSRGRMKHLVADAASLSEKQAIAGKAVAEARMQAARHAVLKAMDSVERSGAPFTQAEVVRASGLSRNTVSKHWRFCLTRRPRRCLDKKGGVTPAIHNMAHTVKDLAHSAVESDGGQKNMNMDEIRKPPVRHRPAVSMPKAQDTAVTMATNSVARDGIGNPTGFRKPTVSRPVAELAVNRPRGDESVSVDPNPTETKTAPPAAREIAARPSSPGAVRPLPPLFLYAGEARRREEERREIARRLAAPVAHDRSAGRR